MKKIKIIMLLTCILVLVMLIVSCESSKSSNKNTINNYYDDFKQTTAVKKTEGVKNNSTTTTTQKVDTKCSHKYQSKVTKEATCVVNGKKTFTCSLCNDSYTEIIEAKGHTEVVDKAVASTCTEKGKSEGIRCSTCNAVIVPQRTLEANGHTEVIDEAVAATCVSTGKTEGKHCSACNEILVAQKTVVAKGHTEVVDKAVAATCLSTGKTEGKHCSVCSEILLAQKTVDAIGHLEVIDEVVEPTCGKVGKTEGKHCSRCNEVLIEQNDIPATGDHSGQYTCEGCGISFYDMLKNLLIEHGTYKSDGYEISYDATLDRVCLSYYDPGSIDISFFTYIKKNSSSFSWKYSYVIDAFGYNPSTGSYTGGSETEQYLKGNISYNDVNSSLLNSQINYSYSTFAEVATKTRRVEASNCLLASVGTLCVFISEYSNGEFSLYNLGFSSFS